MAVAGGVVSHAWGRRASYGELARFAAATPPGRVQLKNPKEWRLIGRTSPRLDVPAKVNGAGPFALHGRLPAMRHPPLRGRPAIVP